MQQVKDAKFTPQTKVDSLQNDNRFKTCCKLSQNISSASPQFSKGDAK